MTLEQAKELEANRWMLVKDEAARVGIEIGLGWSESKYRHLHNAILAWGESLADLRSHQPIEERVAAASEASNRYIREKRV